jgi:tripartite-type tricarboxylate transporter receptor subunit TctC
VERRRLGGRTPDASRIGLAQALRQCEPLREPANVMRSDTTLPGSAAECIRMLMAPAAVASWFSKRNDMNLIKQFLVMILALVSGLPPAVAQTYPDRVIKLVVPFPAGSTVDALARFMADELRKELGQTLIVDNQAGADGIIAAQAVKRAAPDGYTLMVSTSSPHAANRALYPQLPYDPEKDFEPIGTLMRIPQLLVVKKDFPANDVAGLVALVKKRPVKSVSFGTGNTSSRVLGELLNAAAKIQMTPVPYRGMPQVLQDLAGGQIDLTFTDLNLGAPLISGGQIKALANTDSVRLPSLPNVPTMAEAGYKSVELTAWAGVFAPAKTDPAIVERLNRDINKILATARARDYIQKMGATPMAMTPGEFRTFVSSEIARWGRFVELAGIEKK